MSVHSADAFRHATELVGTKIQSFCHSMPNFTLQKGKGFLYSVVEKSIMKMQKKTQRHTRGLAAQFIDFLHTLEYQHINYTLEWYLLRCFYRRIRNFRKKFWKRYERLFQKMFALIRKQHSIFRKLVRNFFCKIVLANSTCFQQVFENYVKARQTNENWITHKQMLAAKLSTPVVLLQMSECSIFVFAIIFPVLTHWFSTAPSGTQILARKTLFQQQYLKTPFWINDPKHLRQRFW